MKIITGFSSIVALALASDDCCEETIAICERRNEKQCPPPPGFRNTCGAFCATPVEEPRDCSNRGSKNSGIFMNSGIEHGDTMGPRSDDTAVGPITLRNDAPYFGSQYNNVYFSSNGLISFNQGFTGYTSSPFPLEGKTLFSPFWGDFNTAIEGDWMFRELRPGSDLQEASVMVNYELDAYSDFQGTDGVVVTYKNVAHYGRSGNSDRTNTMQAIVVHDNNHSFVIFNYGDIEWTTGTASNGDSCDGLGGTPAQVGFNDGYGNYFSMPGSQTNDIQNVDDWSNCKTQGRLIFKVDGINIQAETPSVYIPLEERPVEASIVNPINGIQAVLQQSGLDISEHGCYCAKMNGGATAPSFPIDELDKLCKNWLNGRSCILKTGGDCEAGSVNFYTALNPSNCDSGENVCETMACQVDQHFIAQVQSYMEENPNWTANANSICDSARNSNNIVGTNSKKDSCCGSDPAALIPYASADYTCVDSQLETRVPSAADCTEDETWDEASQSCSATLNAILNSGTEWEQNSLGFYIHISDDTMNWDQAQTYCQGLGEGAEMAMPSDDEQNRVFFDSLMAKTNDFGWWGFKRFTPSDLQTWNGADMRPMDWSNWCSGEPNNWNNEERCAITWSNTNPCWNDINCANNYRAICIYYA